MRIGLVVEAYDPARGGAEQWSYQFARQLDAWGHEVHVVARQFAPLIDHRIVRHYLPECRSRLDFAQAASEKISTFAPDVVHDTGVGWRADVFQPHGGSRLASFEQNLLLSPAWLRPLKTRLSTFLPRYREFRHLIARQYANDGRTILAISKMVARDIQRWHGVSPERIRIVYNGVDANRFSPAHRQQFRESIRQKLGVADREFLILIVAHNFVLKGVPALLRAVGTLRRERLPVRLVVVGGKKITRYQKMAHRWGAGKATTFAGPAANPIPYYAAADLYVQPTLYDPCSLVVLEALASGLPVITTRFNGAGELLTAGVEGYVLDDPFHHGQLADHVRSLLDRQRLADMGRAARQLALAHTFERNCREILDLYDERNIIRRRAA